jgi:hypothetical protein
MTDPLARFDDAFCPVPPPPRSAAFYNGDYYLTVPDGSVRLFRVTTQYQDSDFMPGRRLIAERVGPDGSTDFERFGTVDDRGVHPWKRWRDSRRHELGAILWDLARGELLEGYSFRCVRRCLACNRVLNDPQSAEAGIGPECARKP